MQSPPLPRYLVPPKSKYSPQHHVLKHPQFPFLPQCHQRPSFTPIQNNRQNYSSIYIYIYIYIALNFWIATWKIKDSTQVKLIVEMSAAVRVVHKLEAPHYATFWPSYYFLLGSHVLNFQKHSANNMCTACYRYTTLVYFIYVSYNFRNRILSAYIPLPVQKPTA